MSELIEVSTPRGPGLLYVDAAPDPAAPRLLLNHGAGAGVDTADLRLLADRLPGVGLTVMRFEQPWKVAGGRVASAPVTLDEALMAACEQVASMAGSQRLVIGGRSAGARSACRVAALLTPVPRRARGRADDRADDRVDDRVGDGAGDRAGNWAGDRVDDWAGGGAGDGAGDRAGDRAGDWAGDGAGDRARGEVCGVVTIAFPLQPPSRGPRTPTSREPELLGVGVPVLAVQGTRDPFGGPGDLPRAHPGIRVVALPGADHSLRLPARPAPGQLTASELEDLLVAEVSRFVVAVTAG